ncbi:hypothetical protein [Amycolatopsis minnesotensis]|uniref:Helix-turn-helix DNA binding domain protein n=1 Tax=Amycolatopsis minnesotensis TaxID=337894 RepID=A0ABP5BBT0_9PSEU
MTATLSPGTIELLGNIQADLNSLRERCAELVRENARLRDTSNNGKKLAPADVSRMRTLRAEGWKQSTLADAFDVNPATVSRIVRGLYHQAAN